jgi:hypothetical protein
MHKSTRYGYSVQKRYFEMFFAVRSTTRTTDVPDIDHRQKRLSLPERYFPWIWCLDLRLRLECGHNPENLVT